MRLSSTTFGRRLNAIRRDRGLTQMELGAALGKTGSSISGWEHGHGKVRISVVEKCAEALGCGRIITPRTAAANLECLAMSDMSGAGLAQLVQEIKLASANIRSADDENRRRLDGIEVSVNELFKRTGRPGGFVEAVDEVAERKSAVELCQIRKSLVAEGDATAADYMPGSTENSDRLACASGPQGIVSRWSCRSRRARVQEGAEFVLVRQQRIFVGTGNVEPGS